MLKSCPYCGRIHDSKFICLQKEKAISKKKKMTDKDKFRGKSAWKRKREEIKERDNFVCQVCVRNLYNPLRIYETDNLQVHHVIPLEKDYNKRLDNDNLITLCERHHEMAEAEEIPIEVIKGIVLEQENEGTRPESAL